MFQDAKRWKVNNYIRLSNKKCPGYHVVSYQMCQVDQKDCRFRHEIYHNVLTGL